jgi:hypothetical protein
MADQLKGKRVVALAAHGFEQDELLQPAKHLFAQLETIVNGVKKCREPHARLSSIAVSSRHESRMTFRCSTAR